MRDFYVKVLDNASSYSRATGYFSSAVFALAPLAFGEFFASGGTIRLVCSPKLTEVDVDSLGSVSASSFNAEEQFRRSLHFLNDLASDESNTTGLLFRLFAALIASGRLQMRLAVNLDGNGIFHDKYGIFMDEIGNAVTFIGSANESAAAWSGMGNHEQFEVFCNWIPDDAARSLAHIERFDDLWKGADKGIEIVESIDVRQIVCEFAPTEPVQEILSLLRKKFPQRNTSKHVSLEIAPINLYPHQSAALENWRAGGRKGIIKFATGGGKTLTAISEISEWLASGGVALVLVPSVLLARQWYGELIEHIAGVSIFEVGGRSPKARWKKLLEPFVRTSGGSRRVVLSTYTSAASPEFRLLFPNSAELLVIGDEVHRFGAPDTRGIGSWLKADSILGLSATPERFGDADGTQAILEFFGQVVYPEFTLSDAIAAGVLVPYEYHLDTVALSEEEQHRWDSLTQQIIRDWLKNDKKFSEYCKKLLIRRSKIAKRAFAKGAIASAILFENYKPGDRWLVYCESVTHLAEVRAQIEGSLDGSVTIMEYHSQNVEERERVIEFFTNRGGIILAIKCLDEGIDIPEINKAIILSSSSNPREFIQRRGRVLRRAPGKSYAMLWDIVVTDVAGVPLTHSELMRAQEFATNARNYACKIFLENLIERYPGRNEFDSMNYGIEEDWSSK